MTGGWHRLTYQDSGDHWHSDRMRAPDLQLRNNVFAIDDTVPRDWLGGRRGVTGFFDNLSLFFPAGERFFIASVKAHRDRVRDPALRAQVADFCAQEGAHRREHRRYNDMLEAGGLPARAMERRVERLLARVSRRTPRRWQLAATCALEHFTALMANLLLSNRRLLDGAHPAMAALWLWHAAEENEHKAVAFDVYRAAGGNYAERCVVMSVATVVFWAKVAEHQVRVMHARGILASPREWWRLGRFLLVSPGGMLGLIPKYLAYYRPGFHPWDHDNRELLEAWKREYDASPEYRRVA
jgi:uncharacterized protein